MVITIIIIIKTYCIWDVKETFLRDQFRRDDEFVQEVAQFCLHHLAVSQLGAQGEGLVL